MRYALCMPLCRDCRDAKKKKKKTPYQQALYLFTPIFSPQVISKFANSFFLRSNFFFFSFRNKSHKLTKVCNVIFLVVRVKQNGDTISRENMFIQYLVTIGPKKESI